MVDRIFRTHPHRTAIVGASALALALGVAFAPTASAQAATRQLPAAGSDTSLRSFHFVTHDAKTGAPLTITCTPNLEKPFRYSGGIYGQGVEAFAGITCTQPVYEIDTVCALDDYTTQVAFNSHTIYSTTTGSCDAEAAINPGQVGQYTTLAQFTITVAYGGTPNQSPVYQTTPPVTLHY